MTFNKLLASLYFGFLYVNREDQHYCSPRALPLKPYTGPWFGDICPNQGDSGYMTWMWGESGGRVAGSETLVSLPISLRVQGSIFHTQCCFQPGSPLPSFPSSSNLGHFQGQGRKLGLDWPPLNQSKENPGWAFSLFTCLIRNQLPAS